MELGERNGKGPKDPRNHLQVSLSSSLLLGLGDGLMTVHSFSIPISLKDVVYKLELGKLTLTPFPCPILDLLNWMGTEWFLKGNGCWLLNFSVQHPFSFLSYSSFIPQSTVWIPRIDPLLMGHKLWFVGGPIPKSKTSTN